MRVRKNTLLAIYRGKALAFYYGEKESIYAGLLFGIFIGLFLNFLGGGAGAILLGGGPMLIITVAVIFNKDERWMAIPGLVCYLVVTLVFLLFFPNWHPMASASI